MSRERLGSRLGFILLSAGCAIGIGNVWKFPYMVGQYGGGIFVLIYLFFLAVLGIPVMTMEFSLGRASQKSPVHVYKPLAGEKTPWNVHGWASMIGSYLLMMFYTVVSGWMLRYFVSTAKGDFEGLTKNEITDAFSGVLADPVKLTIYTVIIIVLGFFVCSFDLQKGLERITKYMMLVLLVIMVILAINGIFLPGGIEGLKFYLVPNVENIKRIGITQVIAGAMQQSFFTLSLGMGAMAIFGSYLNKDRALMGEAVNVAVLDTFVAIVSGLIIFPACYAFDVKPDSGPDLIFITLPNIFNNMKGGRIWGSLFFLFLCFAAFSTVLAVFQSIIACCEDAFGWSKKKSCIINCIAMIILSMPCILGFNVLSGIKPFGGTSGIMDLEDFLVSNLLLPLGSLAFIIFCTAKFGWDWKKFTDEANQGKGLKIKPWMRVYFSYILPIIVFAVFVLGLLTFFKVI